MKEKKKKKERSHHNLSIEVAKKGLTKKKVHLMLAKTKQIFPSSKLITFHMIFQFLPSSACS